MRRVDRNPLPLIMVRGAHFAALLTLLSPRAAAQDCTGNDPEAARAEREAGSALLEDAIEEARQGGDRAGEIAREALAHFDRQCEHGDVEALAQRGAALMLMGAALRSAQSYDAFLRARTLDELDARTRSRIEANLQPGRARVVLEHGTAQLFVDGLDFGPLPRDTEVRLPAGAHRFEARRGGSTIASATAALTLGGDAAVVTLRAASLPAHYDFTGYYVATIAVGVLALVAGPSFLALADERQRTYDGVCASGLPAVGCEATLAERDAATGLAVASFALAGLAVVGLVVVIAMDSAQPRSAIALRPGGAFFEIMF